MIKRRWKTCLWYMLMVVLLLLGVAAHAEPEDTGALKLPDSLEVIGQEAFMNTASVRSIILPESAREIHARAFAGSSVRTMNLPETIEYIADDAFADCNKLTVSVLRDSYAHRFAFDHRLQYNIIEPESGASDENAGYVIHNVECITESGEGNPEVKRYFRANVDMSESCLLEIRLYDEDNPDGEPIQFYCEPAHEAGENQRIDIAFPYDAHFPEYFILDVRLIHAGDGRQKGEAYITYAYTRRRAEIMSKTPADYTGRVIVSYGDAGYAVLEDGVIRATGTKSSGGYILTPPRALEKGDVLYLDLGEDNKAVKVNSVADNGDGSVTVTPDEDICLSDVFIRLDISGYMQPAEGPGAASSAAREGGVRVIPISPEFKFGPVTVEGSAGVSVKMDVKHDKEADYYAVECWVETTADLEIMLSAGTDSRDWEENPFVISPGTAIRVKIPGTDIGGELGLTIPLNFALDVGGSIFVNVKNRVGFTFNTDDGKLKEINRDESKAYAEVVGELSADFGPQIGLDVDLMDMLKAGIRGQAGVQLEGELEGLQYGGSVSDPEAVPLYQHACLGCLNCDLSFFAGIWATLEGELGEHDYDLFDKPVISIDPIKIGDAYWSFLNEEESVYGGKASAGLTECINNKYRTHFTTYDYRGDEISGVPLSVPAGKKVLSGISPAGFYLYPGKYGVTAGFASGDYTETFFVTQNAVYYPLEEPDVKIVVKVVDAETKEPVSGAAAEYTLPDGSKVSGITDDAGQTRFEHLPGGEYSLTVNASGYMSQTMNRLTYVRGMNVMVEVELTADKFPVLTANVDAYAGGSHFKDQALTENGTCPDGVPEIWLSKTGYDKVQVAHENWSKAFSYDFLSATGKTALLAIHMGNNEYTYVLIGDNISQMGGQEIVVFHEKGGAFEILAKFDGGDDRYDRNVTIDATFTSKADFSGVIYPTEYRFEGRRTAGDLDYYNRVGVKFWRTNNLGYMDYGMNTQGYYDLVFKIPEVCYGIIGYSATRYCLSGGTLRIAGQWFEPVYGTLTYPE